jgi:putative transposase
MSERREKIHTEHELTKTRRCELLEVARSSAYYHPEPVSEADLALMRLIDEIHLQWPFYGSRRTRDELEDRGHTVNRKRVQRLMRLMDLRALYPRRRTSQPAGGTRYTPTCSGSSASNGRTTSGPRTLHSVRPALGDIQDDVPEARACLECI